MVAPEEALRDWAASGAMALTGFHDGPPMAAPGTAATVVRKGVTSVLGRTLPGLLGERAAYAGLRRNAPWSCGGSFRVLATRDGHLGLSLPRPEDLALLPALVGDEIDPAEPWAAAESWARATSSADALARVRLLELAGDVVPASPPSDRPPVEVSALGTRRPRDEPLVVDLTSLWAGPLCAHLLGLTGARVVKVESRRRPDGARRGTPAFFDLLHRDHEMVSIDFGTGLSELRALVAEADLVLEASRPRALRRLGLVAEDVVAAGTSWLSITARGRASDTVGFGDDVAVAGGLSLRLHDAVVPVGDALADPLTGVTAAVHARQALASEEARLVDVSMLHVASATARGPIAEHRVVADGDRWWVETDAARFPVLDPRVRR